MAVIGAVTDDFTGTASAGVLVARSGAKTGLFFDAQAVRDFSDADRLDAIYVSSNSRHLSSEDAYRAVTETTQELFRAGVKYYSKKIDTTLRGGIGYEIDAMLEQLGENAIAVMVTAMPASRRICVGGYSVIDGTILTETPVVNDVKTPVKECYVPELIRSQSRYSVDLISLKEVLMGKDHLTETLKVSRKKGNRILVTDAITMEHIDTIAEACVELGWKILAVDPGPFTMKLAYRRGLIQKEESVHREHPGEAVRKADKTALFMVGSANPSTKQQIERLLLSNEKAVRISASPESFIKGAAEAKKEAAKVAEEILKKLKENDKPEVIIVETALHGSVIDLKKEDEKGGYAPGTSSARINEGLARITETVLAEAGREKIAGLLLTGGDTMESICRRIGVECIQALDNIVAQVDVGRIIGKYDGLPVVVKGGFCGYEDVAADIAERIFAEASR